MTTGRINQVTILKVRPRRSRHTVQAQQSWLLIGLPCKMSEHTPYKSDTAASSRERRLQPGFHDHPIAPTEFPKRWSAIQAFQRERLPEV